MIHFSSSFPFSHLNFGIHIWRTLSTILHSKNSFKKFHYLGCHCEVYFYFFFLFFFEVFLTVIWENFPQIYTMNFMWNAIILIAILGKCNYLWCYFRKFLIHSNTWDLFHYDQVYHFVLCVNRRWHLVFLKNFALTLLFLHCLNSSWGSPNIC